MLRPGGESTHICMRTNTDAYAHAHAHIHAYTHTHTHTHTDTPSTATQQNPPQCCLDKFPLGVKNSCVARFVLQLNGRILHAREAQVVYNRIKYKLHITLNMYAFCTVTQWQDPARKRGASSLQPYNKLHITHNTYAFCTVTQWQDPARKRGASSLQPYKLHITRVGQNRIFTPYLTVYLVISLPKVTYMHRIYMVLANPTHNTQHVRVLYCNSTAGSCTQEESQVAGFTTV